MVNIIINSDSRGEGKTNAALKSWRANPGAFLVVGTPTQVSLLVKGCGISSSEARRVIAKSDAERVLCGIAPTSIIVWDECSPNLGGE